MSGDTVFVVDEGATFRARLREALEARGSHVVGFDGDVRDAVAQSRALVPPPGAVVIGPNLDQPRELEIAAALVAAHPAACVVLLTESRVDRYLRHRAADLGVRAVLGVGSMPLLADTIVRLLGEAHGRDRASAGV